MLDNSNLSMINVYEVSFIRSIKGKFLTSMLEELFLKYWYPTMSLFFSISLHLTLADLFDYKMFPSTLYTINPSKLTLLKIMLAYLFILLISINNVSSLHFS